MNIMKFGTLPFLMEEAGEGGGAGGGTAGGTGGAAEGATGAAAATGGGTTGAGEGATQGGTGKEGATGGGERKPIAGKEGATDGKTEPPAFKIPDAYKDKPWASKIKSEEDLYKQIETLDALKGKKHIAPDFKTAKPEELEAYYSTTRPETKEAYAFAEGADEGFKTGMSDAMWNAGISEHQFGIIKGTYDKMEKAAFEAATSADGFAEVMKANFGDKYDGIVVTGENAFKARLSKEQGELLNVMPNQFTAPLYALVQSYEKTISDLKAEYGVTEKGDAHTGATGSVQGQDVAKTRTEIRKSIADLEKGPHTAEAKQKLVDQLHATYSNQSTTMKKR